MIVILIMTDTGNTESFSTKAMIQSIGYDWNLKCSLKEKLF